MRIARRRLHHESKLKMLTEIYRQNVLVPAARVVAALLVMGSLNGFAFRVIAAWRGQGIGSAVELFGTSPFEIVVAGIAARMLLHGDGDVSRAALGVPAYLFCLVILWPSSSAAWIAVALYGATIAFGASGAARNGALLFSALAVCALWAAIGEPIAGTIILTGDAAAVAWVMSWFRDAIVHTGNIVGDPNGHRIIVLTACSSFHVMPLALLSWAALYLDSAPVRFFAAWPEALGLAVILVALNLARLTLMAWSPSIYANVHGLTGAIAFDLLATLAVVGCAGLAIKRHA
jgi:hypothetical protein